MAMKFYNCYKVVIQSLCDWTNWTSKYSKLIDECSQSDDEEVNLYQINPIPADEIGYFKLGNGQTPTTGCFPGKILPDIRTNMFMQMAVDYMGLTNGFAN